MASGCSQLCATNASVFEFLKELAKKNNFQIESIDKETIKEVKFKTDIQMWKVVLRKSNVTKDHASTNF